MSIIDTFDGDRLEIIIPYQAIEKVDGFPETVVAVFSVKLANKD